MNMNEISITRWVRLILSHTFLEVVDVKRWASPIRQAGIAF